MNKQIKAEIIADSVSPQGHRITTYVLTFPRFILAELNTHRLFSKNSASSRAIPFEKMVKMVEEDPFIPIAWQKDHKGMQGTEYFTSNCKWNNAGENYINKLEQFWLNARTAAVTQAKYLNMAGVTKQLCNRLLEPFMWHTVILTATEFDNFFELRCPQYEINNNTYHSKSEARTLTKGTEWQSWLYELDDMGYMKINKGQSEIHMMALAECMWDEIQASIPKKLLEGEYHIPFVEIEEDI